MNHLCKIVAAGLIGMTLLAEDAPKASERRTSASVDRPTPTTGIANVNRASTVIGMAVQESGGKILGKVHELVLDLENGRVGYAVLALGPNRLVPVPITALKHEPNADHFVLNMTSSLLAAAPGIQNDVWPAINTFAVGAPAQSETGRGNSSDADAK